jgi:hypothetical protein
MHYILIDPPVSGFSPPEEISAWIAELRSRAPRPEFQYAEGREVLDAAIAEAEEWLQESRRRWGGEDRRPPERPAAS